MKSQNSRIIIVLIILILSCTHDSEEISLLSYLEDCTTLQSSTQFELKNELSPSFSFEIDIPSKWPIRYDETETSRSMYFGDTTLLNSHGIIFTIGISELMVKSSLDNYFNTELNRVKKRNSKTKVIASGNSNISEMNSMWVIFEEKYNNEINKNLMIYYTNNDNSKKYVIHFTSSDVKSSFKTQICTIIPVIESFKIIDRNRTKTKLARNS